MQSVLSNRDYCRSWTVHQVPLRLWKPYALNGNSRFRVDMADFDTFLTNSAGWHNTHKLINSYSRTFTRKLLLINSYSTRKTLLINSKSTRKLLLVNSYSKITHKLNSEKSMNCESRQGARWCSLASPAYLIDVSLNEQCTYCICCINKVSHSWMLELFPCDNSCNEGWCTAGFRYWVFDWGERLRYCRLLWNSWTFSTFLSLRPMVAPSWTG